MHVVAVITEYNPFHNGHLYHIKKARQVTGADYCVAVMSGSFVQRGEPALYDKYIRCQAALLAGADLVLEMPVTFSTASAREFSQYGVALLSRLGMIDSLCFGSEAGELSVLEDLALILSRETKEYTAALKQGVKAGMTYPKARELALLSCVTEDRQRQAALHLSSPNNILGLEYISAIRQQKSTIAPYTIKRMGSGYHDPSLNKTLGSALAIRTALKKGQSLEEIAGLIPAFTRSLYENQVPVFQRDLSLLLHYQLSQALENKEDLNQYADFTPALCRRIENQSPKYRSFEQQIQSLKTKDITYSRLSRCLTHLLLHIRQDHLEACKDQGYALYGRILGFGAHSGPLRKALKANTSIPLVNKMGDAKKSLSPLGMELLNKEVFAQRLYQSLQKEKGQTVRDEYQRSVIRISETDCIKWD